jgi:hypothetical protein
LKPLIDEIEVSPHKVTTRGENLYHVMIRAVANGEPPADVIAVFREECKQRWGDQERGRKEAEDKKKPDRPNCAPPIIISSSAAEQLADTFADSKSALLKYVMIRYRVYPRQVNSDDMNPAQLASSLDLPAIADYFTKITSKQESLKRLIGTLPDTIFREVVYFL